MMRLLILLGLGVTCAWIPSTIAAQSVIDPDASVVELRAPASVACPTCTGCEVTPGNYLDNCFEDPSALSDWLWGGLLPPAGRNGAPTSVDMVAVRVGPGEFPRLKCVGDGEGWVTVIGSGREHTRFVPDNPNVADPDIPIRCVGGIDVNGCTGLGFQDLTVQGLTRGVNWIGTGSSQWRDVDIIADAGLQAPGQACLNDGSPPPTYAWWDRPPWGSSGGPHFFWNSRFVARNISQGPGYAHTAFASDAPSTEHWFYACDFLLDKTGTTNATLVDAALWAAGPTFVFGSTIRVRSPNGLSNPAGLPAMGVFTSHTFHMHGGIINVNIAAQDQDVVAIQNAGSGLVHTPETAFNLRESVTGGASTWRLRSSGTGSFQSPFQWPASTSAPDLFSEHGQDMFVKTDAGPGGDETRLFIYDTSCGTLWRDTTGSCL